MIDTSDNKIKLVRDKYEKVIAVQIKELADRMVLKDRLFEEYCKCLTK